MKDHEGRFRVTVVRGALTWFVLSFLFSTANCQEASRTGECCPKGAANCNCQCETGVAKCIGPILSSTAIVPAGDLVGRTPYQSLQIYYYKRPYSPLHSVDLGQVHRESLRDTEAFQSVYESVEQQIMLKFDDDAVTKDRAFEFNDWQKYRTGRLKWESDETVKVEDVPAALVPTELFVPEKYEKASP